MKPREIDDPGPVLQHLTGLERDYSEAPSVRNAQYYAKESRQVANFDTAQAERIGGALYVLDGLPPAERTAIAAFVLDRTGAGFPQVPGFGDIREQAELWGDWANHVELVAYVVAGLHRFGRVPLALMQRKRLFRALWDGFSDADRFAFLASVGKNS